MSSARISRLELQPIHRDEAFAFIKRHHRHLGPPTSWKFGVAVNDGATVRGVVCVGRPVARHMDDGYTAEVTRCCTDGAKNAASMLYAAAWRASRALGYRRLVTYSLVEEGGASLRAAGWRVVAERRGRRSWNCQTRPRVDSDRLTGQKLLWEAAGGE